MVILAVANAIPRLLIPVVEQRDRLAPRIIGWQACHGFFEKRDEVARIDIDI